MNELKDVVGQPINVGDIIVYTNKSSSSTITRVGIVKKINSTIKEYKEWDCQNRKYKETPSQYTEYSLVVRSIDRWSNPLALSNKDVNITRIERVTKVRFEDMAREFRDVFRPLLTQYWAPNA